jgi:hypothetical protein
MAHDREMMKENEDELRERKKKKGRRYVVGVCGDGSG